MVKPSELKNGLYRIHWASGGTSLAAVGITSGGERWVAPTNWTQPGVAGADVWADIVEAERLLPGDMSEMSTKTLGRELVDRLDRNRRVIALALGLEESEP